ncbi:hypothetical protein GCM10022200_02510 [Microbacterium awajiense]|uniref:Uncharacterized protein n=1 Tax=Microbacterium awajiense TaxID=415214 RepID=A0ABP7A2Q0_9MICO
MRVTRIFGAAAVVAAAIALSACTASSTPAIEPVVMDANSLQGATVDLEVGQSLDIDTGSLAVDSYMGEVADPSIAEFVPGREEGGTTYNPGVTALAPGTTAVTMSNSTGGIQDLTFTVNVSG